MVDEDELIMKTLLFFGITMFSLNVISQNISGNWKWQYDNGKHISSLTFSNATTNGNYLGNYCSVFYEGSKIDCVDKEDVYCLNLSQVDTNIYEGTFKSFSHQGSGTIRLNYNPTKDELSFEILSKKGIYYLPKNAVFER